MTSPNGSTFPNTEPPTPRPPGRAYPIPGPRAGPPPCTSDLSPPGPGGSNDLSPPGPCGEAWLDSASSRGFPLACDAATCAASAPHGVIPEDISPPSLAIKLTGSWILDQAVASEPSLLRGVGSIRVGVRPERLGGLLGQRLAWPLRACRPAVERVGQRVAGRRRLLPLELDVPRTQQALQGARSGHERRGRRRRRPGEHWRRERRRHSDRGRTLGRGGGGASRDVGTRGARG